MEHQRPHKRRRQVPTGRFAGLAGGDDNNFLVLGLPSTIFDDPDAAAFVEEGHHLIEISPGNKSDRYDVRLLLDARVLNALEDPSLLTGGAPDEEDQQLHAELELERWRDLHEQAAEQPGGGDGERPAGWEGLNHTINGLMPVRTALLPALVASM
jgi:hypothetical protein